VQGLKYNEIAFKEAERMQDVELVAPVGWDLCVAYGAPGEFSKVVEVAGKALALVESTQT
jgi:hypothetical protein